MSLQVITDPHQRQVFTDNVKMVAQQTKSLLRDTIMELPAEGEAKSAADLIGAVEAQEDNGIDRRNIENIPARSRRWLVFPNRTRSGQYIDKQEKLLSTQDPTSNLVRSHTLAVQRGFADKILGIRYVSKGVFEPRAGGILGGASDGKMPGGALVQLPAKSYTAADGVGLTLAKLIASKERLNIDNFGMEDDDEMFCAITPKQVTDLLKIAAATGTSLNQFDIDQLKTGKPTTLLGVTWIVTNRSIRDGNGDRLCPMWSKNNIIGGVWQDVTGAMWPDGSANNTPYAQVDGYLDVVRVEDDGVQVIACVES